MESKLKIIEKDIIKRLQKDAANKEFCVNNAEEWYLVFGVLMHYILHTPKTIVKEKELIKVMVTNPKQEALIERETDVFEKYYVGTRKQNDFWDGIFRATLAYRFDAKEEQFDGRLAFNYGRMIKI